MGIKKLTPTSPSRRYQTYLTRDELTVGAVPEKSLLEPKTRISGRNNDGHITVRRRGGGHPAGKHLAADQYPVGYAGSQHPIPSRQRRTVGALGRRSCLVGREGRC